MLRTVTCTKCNRADFPPQVMLHIFHSLFPSYAFHCAVVLKLVALQLNSKNIHAKCDTSWYFLTIFYTDFKNSNFTLLAFGEKLFQFLIC